VESRTRRSDRDAENVGDLGERLARVVLENEDCPLFGRQSSEAALELVAVGDRPELVGGGRYVRVLRQELDGSAAAAFAAGLGDACANDEPVGPGVEPLRIAASAARSRS
jgi:hypothetical protein